MPPSEDRNWNEAMLKASVLLVDDDREYADLLRKVLVGNGLTVTHAPNGRIALDEVSRQQFDVVLMDVTMPEMDGFTALHRLSRSSDVPVIMLTARISAADRVQGLDSGADDYICKPCDPDELISRIRAVLRRTQKRAVESSAYCFGAHRFDMNTRELSVSGSMVRLTSLETALLTMLLQARGKIVSREAISLSLQDRALDVFDRSLDVHVSRLRTKLGSDAAVIQTIRGVGYLLANAEEGR